PKRDMRIDDNWRAALQSGDILLIRFELVVTKRAEPARFQIHDVDKSNEMDSVAIEAVPTITHGVFSKPLSKHPAIVFEDVVFARNIEDAFRLEALERFGKRVDLRWFRKMS